MILFQRLFLESRIPPISYFFMCVSLNCEGVLYFGSGCVVNHNRFFCVCVCGTKVEKKGGRGREGYSNNANRSVVPVA